MGIVYKLTCETGLVYYGSTKHNLEYRKDKGWYKCSCKDFINKKMEVIEECENYKEREDFYIRNNECVNKNNVIRTEEDDKKMFEKRKEQKKIDDKVYQQKVYDEKRFYCDLCNVICSNKYHFNKHNEGYRHKLKYESYLKYGEDWKKHYLFDNKKRYAESKKHL
tara:strand:+ start:110 stop:604 length:495 start_codon:yes stop_codon:yes gene_type:complete